MPYRNSYSPPIPPGHAERLCHINTPLGEYDLNYVIDPVRTLKSDKVGLRPWIPSQHDPIYHDEWQKSIAADIMKWHSFTYDHYTKEDFFVKSEDHRRDDDLLKYAIYTVPPGGDSTAVNDYVLAGAASLLDVNTQAMSLLIGLLILPPFQRTHVQTHTSGLLLHQALDLPQNGGYGFRKVGWTRQNFDANPSKAAAVRLGFKNEIVIHHSKLARADRAGHSRGRPDHPCQVDSIDIALDYMTWEDWEGGLKEHIDRLMARIA